MNLSVQKPPGPKMADCNRGFCTAKSAMGALLLALFGFSPAVVQAAPNLEIIMFSILQTELPTADGLANPGETLRYRIDIENIGDASDTSVVFTITPDANTTLVVGNVTTSQGTVTTGNTGGDTTVEVDVGAISASTLVRIEFDVTINSPLASCTTSVSVQGTVTSATYPGGKVTDDINNAQTDEPTVTALTVSNNAPTAADSSVSTEKGTPAPSYAFSAADFNFSDIDTTDCGDSISKIQITQVISLDDLYLDADNDDTLDVGEEVVLNQEIDAVDILRLKFKPADGVSGSSYANFRFKVKDATDYSAADYQMDINVLDNPPTGTDKTMPAINEDATQTFAQADFGYSDPDGGTFTSVKITELATAGTLFLDANGDDIIDTGEAVILNTPIDVVTEIDAGQLKFLPAADESGNPYATFKFTVNDGALDSLVPNTITMEVTAVNDPPTLTSFAAVVQTTDEDTVVTITLADLTAQGDEADVDGTVDAFVVKSITTGTLDIGAAPGTAWVATTNDTIDATNNAYWTPAAGANGAALDAFAVVAEDDLGAVSTPNVTAQVAVNSVNDPPTFTTLTTPLKTTNEDTEVEITFAELTAGGDQADSDGTVDAFIVKFIPTGTLRIGADTGSATSFAMTSNDSIDASNNAYWTPPSNVSGTLSALAVVAKDDGGAESTTNVTAEVTVSAVNDAPTLTAFAAAVDSTSEDTEVEITLADLKAQGNEADIDGTVDAFVVTSISTGTLNIGASSPGTAWVATTNDTIDATNKAYWTPATDAAGTLDAFVVVAEDNNSEPSTTANVTAQVTVSNVNDPPTATPTTPVITDEDTNKVFAEGEFGFADVDTADTLSKIQITAIPGAGTLYVDADTDGIVDVGEAVAANDDVAVGDITSSKLKFKPVADANGTTYASFDYKVHDATEYSTSAYTITIDVTATNDAPVFVNLGDVSPTYTEGGLAIMLDTDATVSDVELTLADDFNGATLTLENTLGANAEDVFSAKVAGTLGTLTEGGNLTVGGSDIGTVTTNSNGTLLLTFDNTNATPTNALVNSALQQIAYSNSSSGPPASVQIDYSFDDGNVAPAQGTGAALAGTGSVTVNIVVVNDPPVITVPGDQTITEDPATPLTFSSTATPSNAISISDSDAGANGIKVYLTADRKSVV